MASMTLIGSMPMIMANATDGGGGSAWNSASWILTDSTTATFYGTAYTSGTGYIRYSASPYISDKAGGYLKFTKTFTATDSSTYIVLHNIVQLYCDADKVGITVSIVIKHGTSSVYSESLTTYTKLSGTSPMTISGSPDYIQTVPTTSGYSYTYEVRVTVSGLANYKASTGHLCRTSNLLTTPSYWFFSLSITY